MAQVAELFRSGVRLVTLTGTAGIGKSRLAQAYLATRDAAASTFFIDLTHVTTDDEMISSVLDALGAAKGDRDHVVRCLHARGPCLLCLDNFEQLLNVSRATIEHWLRHCPQLSLLTTSRQRLQLKAEHVLQVSPLKADDEGAAVQLLLARARQIRPSFQPIDDSGRKSVAPLADLAQSVDGLPLALELLAPRLVKEGARRLLESMRAAPGGVLPALSVALNSSWETLTKGERAALVQCSVFVGGFSLTDAEAVLRLPDGGLLLETIEALYERSLLFTTSPGRFSMLVSVREFVREHAADLEAVERRHEAYFAAQAEELRDAMAGEGARSAWERMRRSRDNIRCCLVGHDAEVGVRAAYAMIPLVRAESHTESEFARVNALLERVDDARLYLMRGLMHRQSGRMAESAADYEAARRLAEKLDRPDLVVEALMPLSLAHFFRADGDEALRLLLDEAKPLVDGLDDRLLRARLLAHIGQVRLNVGQVEGAEADLNGAVRLCQKVGARRTEAGCLSLLGLLCVHRRREGEALLHLAQAEAIHENTIGGSLDILFARLLRGVASLLSGNYTEAERVLQANAEAFETNGILFNQGANAGYLALAQFFAHGDRRAARAALLAAAVRAGEANDHPVALRFRAFAAAVGAMSGAAAAAQDELEALRAEVEAVSDEMLQLLIGVFSTVCQREADPEPPTMTLSERTAAAVKVNLDVRLGVRLVGRPHVPAPTRGSVCIMAPDGAMFCPPGASQRIDISSRTALRNVLGALVAARQSRASVSRGSLAQAGWPGEKLTTEQAANRVRVAIATLRKLGLRDVISGARGGYYLNPDVVVEIRQP